MWGLHLHAKSQLSWASKRVMFLVVQSMDALHFLVRPHPAALKQLSGKKGGLCTAKELRLLLQLLAGEELSVETSYS